MLKWVIVPVVAIAIGLPFGARADLTEAQRQERCANNQGRIKALETELKSNPDFKSDGEITDLRLELGKLNKARAAGHAQRKCIDDNKSGDECRRIRDEMITDSELKAAVAIVKHYDPDGYKDLDSRGALQKIVGLIDRAMAARPRLAEINQQLQSHRNNLVALQCASTPERTIEPQTASKPSDPGSSEPGGSCGLGKRWEMYVASPGRPLSSAAGKFYERQGDSNRFGDVNQGRQIATAFLDGDQVTISTENEGRPVCDFEGTLQGTTIKGTGRCSTTQLAVLQLEIKIQCQ